MSKRKVRIVRRYVPPKLPEKPKVTEGPKSYGQTKRGQYIVPRFWITQFRNGVHRLNAKESSPWFVIDMEEASLARGTQKSGYPKEEAVRIARKFRDKYGAWSTTPF